MEKIFKKRLLMRIPQQRTLTNSSKHFFIFLLHVSEVAEDAANLQTIELVSLANKCNELQQILFQSFVNYSRSS